MMNNQEARNRLIGALTSVGFHGALLLLFLLTMAWRAPGPPAAEFGVVVNMGFDDVGSGDVQTDKPIAAEEQPQEEQPQEEQPKEEEPQPVVEQPKPAKVDKEEILATKEESPVVVKKEEPKKEEPKKEEPKKEQPKVEPKKEPEKLLTEYKPANPAKTDAKGGNSEGDDVGKTGNKGQPDGNLDPNGQYTGKPGGGGGGDGGMALAMSGWTWSERPRTSGISNNESGRIVFEIECDEDGQILSIVTKEKGVSAATEALLKQELQRISLERTVQGGTIPTRSKGTVTFVIKSR